MIADQLSLPIPPTPRVEPDFPTEARRTLTAALAQAKAATDQPPWTFRKHRYWGVVFPQMSGWLPEAERQPLVAEFMVEWNRIGLMFNEGETHVPAA